jgi:hypothetical protein
MSAQRLQFAEFADSWDILVSKYRDGRKLRRLLMGHPSAFDEAWKYIRTIRCLVNTPLELRFHPIMRALFQFRTIEETIQKGADLLCNIIAQIPGEVILVCFIIFNGTVARNSKFLSDSEKHVWLWLETCILRMLTIDPIFMCKVVSVQTDLGQ